MGPRPDEKGVAKNDMWSSQFLVHAELIVMHEKNETPLPRLSEIEATVKDQQVSPSSIV